MDAAEVFRRALEHRLQEAFADPGAGKPHRILVCTPDEYLPHVLPSIHALGEARSGDTYRRSIRLAPGAQRLIRFRFCRRRRILVATCLTGW